MKSEHQIQDEIRIALSKHGCTIFRSNAGQVTTIEGRQFYGMPKGFPDLCGHRNSDFIVNGHQIMASILSLTRSLAERFQRNIAKKKLVDLWFIKESH